MSTPAMQLTHTATLVAPEPRLNTGKILKYPKGLSVFYEGMRPMGVFLIKKGRIKTSKSSPSGKETMLGITNAGCLLGYNELLNRDYYSHNAVVIEDSEIVFISRSELYDLLKEDPSFLERIQKI